jgi:hypothetical protein
VRRAPRKIAVASITVLLALLASGVARADNPHFRRAQAEKMALEYDRALESLRLARELGTSDARTLAEIYRLAGEIEAGLGRNDAATESFKHLLALDPTATLAPGTSPKLAEPFAAAKAYFANRRPLTIRHQIASGPSPAAIVIVVSDPMGMVAGAAARYGVPGKRSEWARAMGRERVRIALPKAKELTVVLWAFDAHGNRLATIGSKALPIRVRVGGRTTTGPGKRDRGPRSRPFYARWYTWAGVAVVSGAVGTYFGFEKLEADRDIEDLNDVSAQHDFTDTDPIERRGRRAALIANISFATAGVAAIAAGICLLRGGGEKQPRRTAFAPLLTPGGGVGVWVSAGF